MADPWNRNVSLWMEEMTPRRAMENFLDNATPKESPNINDLAQAPTEPPAFDGSPVLPSSQGSSQRSSTKRKLGADEQTSSVSKRNIVDETYQSEMDTIMMEDIPSQLESPVIPVRPKPKQKRRVSTSVFKQIIEKTARTRSQVSAKDVSTVNSSLGDVSIPSTLDSPEVKPRRAMPKSKRVSGAAFKKVIEETVQTIRTNDTLQASPGSQVSLPSQVSEGAQASQTTLRQEDSVIPSSLENLTVNNTGTLEKSQVSSPVIEQPNSTEELAAVGLGESVHDIVEDRNLYTAAGIGFDVDQLIAPGAMMFPVNEATVATESILTAATVHIDQPVTLESREFSNESPRSDEQEGNEQMQEMALEENINVSTPIYVSATGSAVSVESAPQEEVEVDIFEEIVEAAVARSASQMESEANPMEGDSSVFDIPSELDSVGEVPHYRPGPASKKRESIAANFRSVLSQRSQGAVARSASQMESQANVIEGDSSVFDIPSELESAEELPHYRPGPASKKRESIAANFRAVLSQRKAVEVVPEAPIAPEVEGIPGTALSPVQPTANASVRRSSTFNPEILTVSSMVRQVEDYSAHISEDESGSQDPLQSQPQDDVASEISVASRASRATSLGSAVTNPIRKSDMEFTSDESSSTNSSRNRSKKSLNFGDPSPRKIDEIISSLTEDPAPVPAPPAAPLASERISSPEDEYYSPPEAPPGEEEAEEERQATIATSKTDAPETSTGGDLSIRNDEPAAVDQDDDDDEELMEADENDIQPLQRTTSTARTSSTGDKTPPLNMKNSTIIAGGMSLPELPLAMSPISEASDGKEAPPGGFQATPAPSRSRHRSVSQSPMFMTVMQKAMLKTKKEERESVARVSIEAEKITTIAEETSKEPGKASVSSAKGQSTTNPSKGKSYASPLSRFEGNESSSESDWEDAPSTTHNAPKMPPLPLHLAFEDLPDRSRDFVPIEVRLKNNVKFQEKVKKQRAKVEAEKAAMEAKKATKVVTRKPRTTGKKRIDTITPFATNKGNLKFYAQYKVTTEACETFHRLVDEWADFTLDQVENFCADEGKGGLDTKEDVLKLLQRQGIVKNYWEQSGLCHELLTYDESDKLLANDWPSGKHLSKSNSAPAKKSSTGGKKQEASGKKK